MREPGENRKGQCRRVGVRAVTVISRTLFDVSTRRSKKKDRQSWRGMLVQGLPLCIQEARGLALNAWSGGGGVSVPTACQLLSGGGTQR